MKDNATVNYLVLITMRQLIAAPQVLRRVGITTTKFKGLRYQTSVAVDHEATGTYAAVICSKDNAITKPGVVTFPEGSGPESFDIRKLPDLSRESIATLGKLPVFSKVFTGEKNLAFLDTSGKLHVAGRAPALGLGPNVPVAHTPHILQLRVNTLADILELPDNNSNETPDYLSNLNVDHKVSSVAFGKSHLAIVAQDGSLWTAGVGKVGQLGTGARTTEDSWDDDELLWWPKQVTTFQEFDEFIGNCSASTYFTMALTTTGRAYSFGAGFQGELGLGTRPISLTPTPIFGIGQDNPNDMQTYEGAVQISTGATFSVALTNRGRVFWWGRIGGRYPGGVTGDVELPGHQHRAGEHADEEDALLDKFIHTSQSKTPIELEFLNTPRIKQITCGSYFLLATDGSDIWRVGLTPGSNSSEVSMSPSRVERTWDSDETIEHICAGGHNAAAITNTGRLLVFGDNLDFCLNTPTRNPLEMGSLKNENIVVKGASIQDTHACVLFSMA